MILVDKNIRKKVEQENLISENYNENNLNCVSYDLTVDIISSQMKLFLLKQKKR